jgi:hypothetical protein
MIKRDDASWFHMDDTVGVPHETTEEDVLSDFMSRAAAQYYEDALLTVPTDIL